MVFIIIIRIVVGQAQGDTNLTTGTTLIAISQWLTPKLSIIYQYRANHAAYAGKKKNNNNNWTAPGNLFLGIMFKVGSRGASLTVCVLDF